MTSNSKPVADELAGVADLAAALAVERRAVEHDAHRLGVADLVQLVAQLIVRRMPAMMPFTTASASVVS